VLVRRLVSVAVLTFVVTGIAWAGISADLFAGFQRRATDALFPSAPSDPDVVVVGIDRRTIERHGVPLPRDDVAQLTNALAKAGARVIAYDVIFSSETAEQVAPDTRFAQAIDDAGNVVLGAQAQVRPGRPAPRVRSLSNYAEGLRSAHFVAGHVQVNADPDDAVNRSLPLIVELPDGEFLPSLSLAAVMAYRGVDGPVTVRPDGVQIGNRFVPTDASHSMLLNFSDRLSDPSRVISVDDVLDGKVDPKKLAGKIVLVGAVDPALGDQRLAPVNKSTGVPGVLLHANAVNTMLTGTYLVPTSDATTLFWVALLTLLVGFAVLMLPLWLSAIITVLLGIAYFAFTVVRFDDGHVQNVVYPAMALVLGFIGALGLRYFGETRQRRRVTALFSQYVPETVAERLVDGNRAALAAEGERLDMTVLFCDVRGFTALSETLPPATVRVMLNHYYDRVTDLVLEMRGTLMKYVGDEVFAVWGAPLPSDDHPQRALACAIAIQDLTPDLNRELVERGTPEIAFGIGLNTGEAVAAHFGGGRRRQYDVVGDTVNVGARLCSSAGPGEIILSDEVLVRVPDPPPVEPVGHLELKGVSRALRLWRVVRVADPAATSPPTDAAAAGAAATPAGAEPAGTPPRTPAGAPPRS
jgi:adenylate cyclase